MAALLLPPPAEKSAARACTRQTGQRTGENG